MLKKEEIVAVLQKNKPLFKDLGVISIGLFGSYAKDDQHVHSDIDVMVELSQPDWNIFCTIWDTLENELHTKVDLIRKGTHLREKFMQTVEREIIYA